MEDNNFTHNIEDCMTYCVNYLIQNIDIPLVNTCAI